MLTSVSQNPGNVKKVHYSLSITLLENLKDINNSHATLQMANPDPVHLL